MDNRPTHSDELAADMFATTEYRPRVPSERTFLPWHRPRKHFVRRDQWTKQIAKLLSERQPEEPLRYLGLPGTDLLDLRYFHAHLCAANGRPMRFLGFNRAADTNSPEQIDLNISLDEVSRLDGLDPQSAVLPDDFRRLSNTQSIAWKKARALGPFDVVNLDLCDGIAKEPRNEQSMYQAISQLLSLQARSQHPWLLFVTSRIGPPHFDDEALSSLASTFRANLHGCPEFATACRDDLGITDELDAFDGRDADAFFYATVTALCKWVLGLVSATAPSRVQLKSCVSYRVDPTAPRDDLVSFALRIEPKLEPAVDPAGLASGGDMGLTEDCRQAAAFPGRVAKVVLADEVLASNADLRESLVGEMEELLRDARYDPSAYRAWAQT